MLLVVPHGDRATIVDKVDGSRVAVEVSATVGRRIRLAAGACGKVFLAFSGLSDAERERHIAALTHPTPRTLLSFEATRWSWSACAARATRRTTRST